ncbi:hypothetical protein F183_A05030 [Bryobacterales bacterium F-183]|nr:hypothetical protein F183_A05030 [Bryobacterales bacterium F-183]
MNALLLTALQLFALPLSPCDPVLAGLNYPPLARLAHLSGTVTATFRVDSLGRPAGIHLTGHPLLQESVTQALAATGFPAGCSNRTLKLAVEFHDNASPGLAGPNQIVRTSAERYDVYTGPATAAPPQNQSLAAQRLRSVAVITVLTGLLLLGVMLLLNTKGTLRFLFAMSPATAADLPDWALRARDPERRANLIVHAILGAVATAMAGGPLLFAVWSHWQGLLLWPIGTTAMLLGMKPLWLNRYLAVALPRREKEHWQRTPFPISIRFGLLLILAGLAIYAAIPVPDSVRP